MKEAWITETLTTPVRCEVDVLVAGGGTAGVVAALSAARAGAKTALVERASFLGGTLLGGGIKWMSFFNAYLAHGGEKKQCVGGIGQRLVEAMRRAGFSPGHLEEEIGVGHESVGTVVDRELLMAVLLEEMERAGVRVLLGAAVADAVCEGGDLRGVVIESKSGREAILAKCVVDCTGDGDVAAHAGAPFENLPQRLGVGLMFGMGNVDLGRAVEYARENGLLSHVGHGDKGGTGRDRVVWAAIDLYKDPRFADYMQKYGIWGPYIVSTHEGEATYINGVTTCVSKPNSANPEADESRAPFCDLDALDAKAMSECTAYLFDHIYTWSEMMRRRLPGFEKAHLCWSAPDLGVRSTRCFACEAMVTEDDVKNGVVPEDAIGLFGGNDSNYYGSTIAGGGWFGIPYRALVPKKVDGLLLAGRMITRDFVAHMSTRLVAACFVEGEAAGLAAALCAASGVKPRALDVQSLKKCLRAAGAVLD